MRTMASSCLWPQETFPAFYCSYKGVFFHPDSCHPHLPHSRHLLPPPTALSVLPCSGPHPHTAPTPFLGHPRVMQPQPQRCWWARRGCCSPDSDGDAGAAVALLLVLAGAAAHQDVAVLQLLRRLCRQPRATLPARRDRSWRQRHWGGSPGHPSLPWAVLQHHCELLLPLTTASHRRAQVLPKRHTHHSRPTEGDELLQLVQLDLTLHGLGLRQGTHV